MKISSKRAKIIEDIRQKLSIQSAQKHETAIDSGRRILSDALQLKSQSQLARIAYVSPATIHRRDRLRENAITVRKP